MRIAVDKYSYNAIKTKNDTIEYIYLFNRENYKDLVKLNMHCLYYKECDFVDINLTDYDIDCFKKAKITDKDYDKLPEKKNYKIGIIIPNYNYEHTIEKCFNSILSQKYDNYEIIFVDDVSFDKSLEIANYYKQKNSDKFKIVELKQKRYNGGARNEGLLHLSDDVDYVFCLDSDDWLLDNRALEKINNKLQSYPDVLFMGLTKLKDGKMEIAVEPNYKDKYEAIRGWSGCGKVIKKTLAMRQECLYNEGTLKEDRNHHCKICFYMNSFVNLKDGLYVWNRDNNKSITTIRDEIFWKTSTIRHYADTLQLALSIKGKDPIIDEYMNERVMMTKLEIDNGGDKQW